MNLNTAHAKSYIKGLTDLAIKLIANPVDFFRTMPKSGGLLDPLFFILLTVLLSVALIAIESFVSHGVGARDLGMLAGGLILVPLIVIILSFFMAGAFFAIWSFMGSSENLETSYRCVAYTHIVIPVTIILSIVPYLGLLGIAWWLYLMVIASMEVHKVPAKHALLVFGIIALISGLVYYSSVSSAIKAKEHLQELTRELQKMPGKSER